MDDLQLSRMFARIGARVGTAVHRNPTRVSVDIKHDRHGEYFEVLAGRDVEIVVPDIQPDLRHLLLMARDLRNLEKSKFLCGHDERHWFAAAVPDLRGVSGVRGAIEALKPVEVRREIEVRGVRGRDFASRRTAAYKRQGEWFFIPKPSVSVPTEHVLREEPMRRGRGKPHVAQYAFRDGGELVYESSHGHVLGEMEYRGVIRSSPAKRGLSWRTARRNPDLYVKGWVRHADHATIVLDCWHLVRMNTESQAPSMRHLAFID